MMKDYRRVIDAAEVVSFDVFDTLIHRMVERPIDLFDLIGIKAAHALHEPKLLSFCEIRTRAERQAREHYAQRRNSTEISFDEIYQALAEISGWPASTCKTLQELELSCELSCIYANPVMKSMYDYAKQKGKRVIISSDMYLPGTHILKMLEKCGYQAPDLVLVSCDLGASKHEGSLFEHLLKQIGIKSKLICHFGDNRHADYKQARKFGITAVCNDWVYETIHRQMPKFNRNPTRDLHDSLIYSIIHGVSRRHAINNYKKEQSPEKNPWFEIGFHIFGPLFLGKFLWLISQLKKDQPEKVLFFARDGHIEHSLYQAHAQSLGAHIPSEYVYVSRAALLGASFTDFSTHRLWNIFGGKKARTVRENLRRAGLPNAEHYTKQIKQVGFETPDQMIPGSDERMFNLLKILHKEILEASTELRNITKIYINKVCGDHQRIGVVDIGWNGNMQASFSRIACLESHTHTTGYYLALFPEHHVNHTSAGEFKEYLGVHNHQPEMLHRLRSGGVELLEFAFTAPHGTTLGYRCVNGTVEPVLEALEADQGYQGLAADLQEGAKQFINCVFDLIGYDVAENLISTAWSAPFIRLVDHPKKNEAELFGSLTHADAVGSTENRMAIAPKISLGFLGTLNPNYKKAKNQSFWKAGFKKRNRITLKKAI
jgi:HAD superfamily hydrolase (TIGR01549 family)